MADDSEKQSALKGHRANDSYTPVNKTYTPREDINANYQPVASQGTAVGPVASVQRPAPPKGGSGVPSAPPAENSKK